MVATNYSCQDIPSQNTNTVNSFEEPTESERLLLTEGKLWEEQIEEGSEEGEIPDAMEIEDESTDEEAEETEQNINGKNKEFNATKENQNAEAHIEQEKCGTNSNATLKLSSNNNQDQSSTHAALTIHNKLTSHQIDDIDPGGTKEPHSV